MCKFMMQISRCRSSMIFCITSQVDVGEWTRITHAYRHKLEAFNESSS